MSIENTSEESQSPNSRFLEIKENSFDPFTPKSNLQQESSYSSVTYDYSPSDPSNIHSEEDTPYRLKKEQNPTSSRDGSSIPSGIAKSQIKRVTATQIEQEMRRMHARHCQLLKDIDSNYAAIEQETHQRYIEFIQKWKVQLKVKVDQYKKVIEQQHMEIGDIRESAEVTISVICNQNLRDRITKLTKEKAEIIQRSEGEIRELQMKRSDEINSVKDAYQRQIDEMNRKRQDLQYKLEEVIRDLEEQKQYNDRLVQSLEENDQIFQLQIRDRDEQIKYNEEYIELLRGEVIGAVVNEMIANVLLNQESPSLNSMYQEEVRKYSELKRRKVIVKRQIKDWMVEFEKIHGRPCTSSDKQQIFHLYNKYKQTSVEIEQSYKKIQEIKLKAENQGQQIQTVTPRSFRGRSQSPSNSLNMSIDSVSTPNRRRVTDQNDPQYTIKLLQEELDKAEREKQRLQKELRHRSSNTPRAHTPSNVANSIITQTANQEIKELKIERDQLLQEIDELRKKSFLIESASNLGNDHDSWKYCSKNVNERSNFKIETLTGELIQPAEQTQLRNELVEAQSTINDLETQVQQLTVRYGEVEKLKKQITEIEAKNRKEQRELENRAQAIRQKHQEELNEVTKKYNEVSNLYNELMANRNEELQYYESRVNEIEQISIELNHLKQQNQDLKTNLNSKIDELKDAYRQRKLIHNQLEDLKGKIRVFCRIRPMNSDEQRRNSESIITISDEFTINCEIKPDIIKPFVYDSVYGPNSTQQEIFEDMRNLVQSAVDGYNVCVFAYGQTGSGKTYTIQGTQEHPGLTPRGINELFSTISRLPNYYSTQVSCYMVELYQNRLIDLLRPPSKQKPPNLSIKKDNKGMVFIPEAYKPQVSNFEELMNQYRHGIASRHTSSTRMNDQSSRSHLIFSILIEVTNLETNSRTVGKLSLVDLAGSERVSKAESTLERLREGKSINKSLLSLGSVITALSNEEQHIPYRNDQLTMLMQDSLGGSAKTLMIVNLSPASYNREETHMSLYFASNVKMIKNEPVKCVESREMSLIKQDLAMAESDRDRYREILEKHGLIDVQLDL